MGVRGCRRGRKGYFMPERPVRWCESGGGVGSAGSLGVALSACFAAWTYLRHVSELFLEPRGARGRRHLEFEWIEPTHVLETRVSPSLPS